MKCNLKTINMRNDEKVWIATNNVIQDENALILLACLEHFNLGPKRANELIDTIEKVFHDATQDTIDGRLREKIIERLELHGVKKERVYNEIGSFKDAKREYANIDSPDITYKEAKEMQKYMNYLGKVANNAD